MQLVTVSEDAKTKVWRIYCREQEKSRLPPWVGEARKFSQEIENYLKLGHSEHHLLEIGFSKQDLLDMMYVYDL